MFFFSITFQRLYLAEAHFSVDSLAKRRNRLLLGTLWCLAVWPILRICSLQSDETFSLCINDYKTYEFPFKNVFMFSSSVFPICSIKFLRPAAVLYLS